MDLTHAIENDNIELAVMTPDDMNRVVEGLSPEGIAFRALRRKVRYKLYRCRSEASGTASSTCCEKFKAKFESQVGFTGWRFFASQWDVALDDPNTVVSRSFTEQEEWDTVVRAKFPQLQLNGALIYPDIKVKNRVAAEALAQSRCKIKR